MYEFDSIEVLNGVVSKREGDTVWWESVLLNLSNLKPNNWQFIYILFSFALKLTRKLLEVTTEEAMRPVHQKINKMDPVNSIAFVMKRVECCYYRITNETLCSFSQFIQILVNRANMTSYMSYASHVSRMLMCRVNLVWVS